MISLNSKWKIRIAVIIVLVLIYPFFLQNNAHAAAVNDYTQWKQGDAAWNQTEAWPASQYPSADYRYMSQAGCLVTSIAMLLRQYNVVGGDVNSFNPWICNEALKKANAFTDAADLYYAKVTDAYPHFVYKGKWSYSVSNLQALYNQGYACVIQVKSYHYVALKSISGSNIEIMDPGYSNTTINSYSPLAIYCYQPTGSDGRNPIPDSGYEQVLPDGDYIIASALDTSCYLDIGGSAAVADSEANVGLWHSDTVAGIGSWDVWNLHYVNGFYLIMQKGSGANYLEAGSDGNVYIERRPMIYWAISKNDDFSYRIQYAGNGYSLDIANGNISAGTNVQVYPGNGSDAQKWTFIPYKTETKGNKITFELNGGKIADSVFTYPVNVINGYRKTASLAIYNWENKKISTNIYGSEAAVDKNGKVIAVRPYGSENQLVVPEGGFIISGHNEEGECGALFTDKLKVGMYVYFDPTTMMATAYNNYDSYLYNHKYVHSGNTYGDLPTPIKEGYIFDGWLRFQSIPDYRIESDSVYTSGDLYANWVKPGMPSAEVVVIKNKMTVTWPETAYTTHYNLWIMKKDDDGEYRAYGNQKQFVTSPYVQELPEGDYYVELQAYNSNGYENGDWLYTVSDHVYFTVSNKPSIAMDMKESCLRATATHAEQIIEHGIVCGPDSGVDLDSPGRIKIAYTDFDSSNGYTYEVKENENYYFKAYAVWMEGTERRVIYSEEINPSTYVKEPVWGEWSDWTTTPVEANDHLQVRTKVEYSYSDKETTTSGQSTMDGWTQYGTPEISYSGWSGWGDAWQGGNDKEVQTRTVYRYHAYVCPNCGKYEEWRGRSDCGQYTLTDNNYRENWSTIPYSQSNYASPGSYTTKMKYTTSLGDGQRWFFTIDNVNDTVPGTQCVQTTLLVDKFPGGTVIKNQYNYRTKIYTYHYYRWSEWSDWSETEYVADENREVRTRTLYSYRNDY